VSPPLCTSTGLWQPFFEAVEAKRTKLDVRQFNPDEFQQQRITAFIAAKDVLQKLIDSWDMPSMRTEQ
jgi:hypothetical protein